MKHAQWLMGGCLLLAVRATQGQVTNVQTETNLLRLEWAAMPGNPYRVFATPDLVEPSWSNQTPEGVVFADTQGAYETLAVEMRAFYCAMASEYLIVDLTEGASATNYPVSYTNAIPAGGWGDEYKTSKLVLRRIPGGTFTMGSPTNELGREPMDPGCETRRQVMLTEDYYIGVFEVTQKQWERVMGDWPSWFSNVAYRETRPVEQVSYNDIRGTVAGTNWPADGNVDTNSFMGRLQTKTGQTFDLPTEVQWERACRSGTTNALNSGFDLTNTMADVHLDAVGRYWYNGGSGYSANGDDSVGNAKVGSYQASPWGVYDLHGNVGEWSLDRYETLPAGVLDPPGPALGTNRVVRGGNSYSHARNCRSASRSGISPDNRLGGVGFRPSRTLP